MLKNFNKKKKKRHILENLAVYTMDSEHNNVSFPSMAIITFNRSCYTDAQFCSEFTMKLQPSDQTVHTILIISRPKAL